MRTTDEVLKVVAESEFYTIDRFNRNENASLYMCFALSNAAINGLITNEEQTQAYNEVQEYLGGFAFMRTVLKMNGLPFEGEDRKRLYQKWDDRPTVLGASEILV